MSLEVSCLGQFQVRGDGLPIRFATDHGRALLAYLAVEAGRAHTRAYLAFLLWPDQSEPHALNNLRQTLIRLRHSLGLGEQLASFLQITPKTLQFNCQEDSTDGALLDVRQFQQSLVRVKGHIHPSLETCAECMQTLEQAVAIYQGEFLQGLTLRHSQPFTEWAVYVREELHQQMTSILRILARYYEEQGDFVRARQFIARHLTMEPWQEEAHCQMMRVLAKSGQRAAAILQYENCRRLLHEELGIEPSAETTMLYQRIKADTFDRTNDERDGHRQDRIQDRIQARTQARMQDSMQDRLQERVGHHGEHRPDFATATTLRWRRGDLPTINRLYGRHHELAQLEKWLLYEKSRLIMVVGMGGIGKTALTATAAELAARHYDLFLWRSLLNAPTFEEILLDWLSALALDSHAAPPVTLPDSFEERVALLLRHLHQRRCLLVLDNLESIFHADRAGQVLPDYAGYLRLFQILAEEAHQSCLMLTSREQIQGIADREKETPWVRTMHLDGLDAGAAQTLLAANGLTLHGDLATALVHRFSGNPLALKLVAETIQELFNGDAGSFLSTDAVAFDDIRTVLDQQFSRLPELEQEILIWLAIEREPVSLQCICDNLAPTRPMPEVIQAMRALQRRSLLQRASQAQEASAQPNGNGLWSGALFTSPNVIMEYLIERLVQAVCREIEGNQSAGDKNTGDKNGANKIGAQKIEWLHHFALMQAEAKEYVRQSQARLILQPIAAQLEAHLGFNGVRSKLMQILQSLRAEPFPPCGYAAGNLLNLSLLMGVDIRGFDLSGLAVWQADLRKANLAQVNFSGSYLHHSRFADAFAIVHTVAMTPDGALVAGGTGSGEIRLWDAAGGQLLHIFQGHRGPVRSIAIRPDGKILASAGEDHTIRLWSLEGIFPSSSRAPSFMTAPAAAPTHFCEELTPMVRVLTGHYGRVMQVAFDPSGKMLASTSVDGTGRVWDVVSGETRALLSHDGLPMWAAAFSPDGDTIATSDISGGIRLWNTQTAELRKILNHHTALVSTLNFDTRGERLASGSADRTVCIWDIAGGEKLLTLEAADVITTVVFSPHGELLATGGDDRVIRLWETTNWSLAQQLYAHRDAVREIAFSPNRQTLVSAGTDHTVCLWDLRTGHIRHLLSGSSRRINSLAYHPSGKLLASAHYDQSVRLWDVDRHTIQQTLQAHAHSVNAVAFSQDGALLASASDDHTIALWTIPGYPRGEGAPHKQECVRLRHHLRGHQHDVTGLHFHPDGHTLLSSSEDRTVGYWDLATGQLHHFMLADDQPIQAVKVNQSGTLMATYSDRHIRFWDTRQGELCQEVLGHTAFIWSIAFSPHEYLLATGGSDGTVALWDLYDPARAYVKTLLYGHSERVFVTAFSPDGKYLASAGADRTVCLWDAKSKELLHTLTGHSHWIWALAFSPDSHTLASGGWDESICLWDTESGEQVATLRTPGPYEAMNISNATGINEAERTILKQLGAVEQ